ncbi:hypothetical protein BN1088_1500142 [Sphingobacterium sp. PM2-P1-29]|nr:hypothetical protein BN1088_1500142 [Sphingobacterium sp. PM2-P1-29]
MIIIYYKSDPNSNQTKKSLNKKTIQNVSYLMIFLCRSTRCF